jgi:hypothetical protein
MPQIESNLNTIKFDKIEELVRFLEEKKYPLLVYALKHDVYIQEFTDGYIKMVVSDKIHPDVIQNCIKVLKEVTGRDWKIEFNKGIMGETLADKEDAALYEKQRDVLEYPLVRAIMAEFKGAKIESLIRHKIQEETEDAEITNEFNFDEENEL